MAHVSRFRPFLESRPLGHRVRLLEPGSVSRNARRESIVIVRSRLQPRRWMRLFDGDPAAVGQQLQLRGVYVEIVGNRSRRLRRPGPAPPRLLGAADHVARA